MNSFLKRVLPPIIILFLVFFSNLFGHFGQMPMHVDTWQMISKADYYIKEQRIMSDEPFSHLKYIYPEGATVFLVVLKSLTNVDLLAIEQFLPALLNVELALLFYLLARTLFKNELLALTVMAFTLLAISNITILGIFYLAPVAFGMLLSYLFFTFIVRRKWFFAILTFVAIPLTHSSSAIFAFVTLFLYFLFDKEMRKKIKYLAVFVVIGFIEFLIAIGPSYSMRLLLDLFLFEKSQPYISVYLTLPVAFIVLMGSGLYFILAHEKKASKFIIPIFSFLVINAFSYWWFKGTLLAYRRLFVFLYSMLPFFVGYSVWFISSEIERLPKIKKKLYFAKKYHVVLIILLTILVPQTVILNLKVKETSIQWVTKEEHEMFKVFGQNYPDNYLVADHLGSFAFPYYNIKPVVLSPGHAVNSTYFDQTAPCFFGQDIKCFESFFNRTNFEYLYVSFPINSTQFEPFLTYKNNIIYKFKR
jgi:hypothetical protein